MLASRRAVRIPSPVAARSPPAPYPIAVSQSSGSIGRPVSGADTPTTRPLERFWPYAELAEEPTAEELAALDPDLHEALFGTPPGPFSISLQFPPFDAPGYADAVALAKASRDYREIGQGD